MPCASTARTFRPCRHLFTDGHQCGSPALRGEELCFYHHSTRRPLKTQVLHGRGSARAALPEPLDLHAVQRGLAELLRLTAAELIDLRTAAQLHRQLSTASQNLARIERSEAHADARAQALHLDRAPVTDYTNHPTLGTIAIAPEPAPSEVQPGVETPVQTSQTEAQTDTQTDTQTGTQTQVQPNEDFETLQENAAEAGCPIFAAVSPSPQWAPTEAPEPYGNATVAAAQASLPDPIARFTLPPEPEYPESKAKIAAAQEAYADAYNKLAQGIHDRAEARAKLHNALFPLDTLTQEQDEDDLLYDGRLSQLVENLQNQQEAA